MALGIGFQYGRNYPDTSSTLFYPGIGPASDRYLCITNQHVFPVRDCIIQHRLRMWLFSVVHCLKVPEGSPTMQFLPSPQGVSVYPQVHTVHLLLLLVHLCCSPSLMPSSNTTLLILLSHYLVSSVFSHSLWLSFSSVHLKAVTSSSPSTPHTYHKETYLFCCSTGLSINKPQVLAVYFHLFLTHLVWCERYSDTTAIIG